MNFESTATTEQGVLADFAGHAIRELQQQDRLPASMGTNKPLFDSPPQTAGQVLDLIEGGFRQQRGMQGGFATDTPTTDVASGYDARRRQMLTSFEGLRQTAYADGRYPSVGIGFNMNPDADHKGAWDRAFGSGPDAPDWNAVASGRQPLSQEQSRKLFDATIPVYEGIVNRTFSGVDLSEHQRLALVSLAYNGPSMLQPLVDPIRRGDFATAADLIRNGVDSNPARASRRRTESQIFAGTQ